MIFAFIVVHSLPCEHHHSLSNYFERINYNHSLLNYHFMCLNHNHYFHQKWRKKEVRSLMKLNNARLFDYLIVYKCSCLSASRIK